MESDIKKISRSKLTPELALEKIGRWCAYQERSQFETLYKLYEWGLNRKEADLIIAQLIENNFLNEERYAMSFARGKFRIKNWGKVKIKVELKARKVNDYCIKKALEQISDSDYFATLEKIISKKWKETKDPNPVKKQFKVTQAVAAKGYEKELIIDALKKLIKTL